jgi:hypothetical protein
MKTTNRPRAALGLTLMVSATLLVVGMAPASADPPSHAPAWGYRRNQSSGQYGTRYDNDYGTSRSRYRSRDDSDYGTSRSRYRSHDDDYGTSRSRYRSRYDDDFGSRSGQTTRRRGDLRDDIRPNGDRDRDGIPNNRDRDMDNDGAPNSRDDHPLDRRRR